MDPVTQESFQADVLEAPGRVLVDFWAEWCGPCRAVEPILAEIAAAHPEIRVVTCDVDAFPAIAQSQNVMNIPTLLAFSGGRLEKRIVGALTRQRLLDELADWLG